MSAGLSRLVSLVLPLALLASSCVTPSVPIPPPEPEKIAFVVDAAQGTASFSYAAQAGYGDAVVYVYDRDNGQGIITTAEPDGSVAATPPFAAEDGDDIAVTFELDHQTSSVCVTLHDGASSSAFECSQ